MHSPPRPWPDARSLSPPSRIFADGCNPPPGVVGEGIWVSPRRLALARQRGAIEDVTSSGGIACTRQSTGAITCIRPISVRTVCVLPTSSCLRPPNLLLLRPPNLRLLRPLDLFLLRQPNLLLLRPPNLRLSASARPLPVASA